VKTARPGVSPTFARRSIDVVVAGLGLILLLPLFIAVGVAVKVSSRGPIVYRQLRVGQGMVPFILYKFRTMASDQAGSDLTAPDDPRITGVGRVLRATSLDELPQLINVLRGDMTLVGPRPETTLLAARYPDKWSVVFEHRPGVTGLVQLNLRDKDTPSFDVDDVEEFYLRQLVPIRSELDLDYLANPTVGRTLAILGRTTAHLVARATRLLCTPRSL
jgi:lipopolysaccharide/colanic/teichoic acid biosynthesis glycosyltransferase